MHLDMDHVSLNYFKAILLNQLSDQHYATLICGNLSATT
jgi:hypothetical protein